MQDFLFSLISGLGYGALIALIALGYTLVYGIIKLINFAHGEFFMVGAYAGFGVHLLLPAGTPLLLSILVSLLVGGIAASILAGITEWVAYKPIRKSGRLATLLTAIGVSFLLQNIFKFINDAQPLNYKVGKAGTIGAFSQRSVQIFGNGMPVVKFVYLGVTAILMVVLWYIVTHTRFGKAMRALSQDSDAAALMGVNTDAVIRKTFLLGGFLAGVAGTLISFQTSTFPTMGVMPGLLAFVAAVVGGIGNIPGAVIGGFTIGILGDLAVWAGLPSEFKDVSVFVLLIVILVFRPQGIMGRIVREKV